MKNGCGSWGMKLKLQIPAWSQSAGLYAGLLEYLSTHSQPYEEGYLAAISRTPLGGTYSEAIIRHEWREFARNNPRKALLPNISMVLTEWITKYAHARKKGEESTEGGFMQHMAKSCWFAYDKGEVSKFFRSMAKAHPELGLKITPPPPPPIDGIDF